MAQAKKIPEGPWTVEALGEDEYKRLANEYGCFNPSLEPPTFRPPLDLTAAYQAQQTKQPASAGTQPQS